MVIWKIIDISVCICSRGKEGGKGHSCIIQGRHVILSFVMNLLASLCFLKCVGLTAAPASGLLTAAKSSLDFQGGRAAITNKLHSTAVPIRNDSLQSDLLCYVLPGTSRGRE